MALLCYNKGCGQRFDPEHNAEGEWIRVPCTRGNGNGVLLSQSVAVLQPSCQAQCRQPIWQELALELLPAGGSWAGLIPFPGFPFSDSCLYHPGVPIFHDALKVSGTGAGAAAGSDLVPSRVAHT